MRRRGTEALVLEWCSVRKPQLDTEALAGRRGPGAKECSQAPKVVRAGTCILSLEPPGRSVILPSSEFWPGEAHDGSDLRNCKIMHLCSQTSPVLWSYVSRARGNRYTSSFPFRSSFLLPSLFENAPCVHAWFLPFPLWTHCSYSYSEFSYW